MKRYKNYRNIRKKAMIFGLPVAFFAVLMLTVLGSLLVVIFSFSFWALVSLLLFNLTLYGVLIRFLAKTQLPVIRSVFPSTISSKNYSILRYED